MDFTAPRSATVGVEFTNTSVTTNGDGGDVGTTWEATRGDNPHTRYHTNRRRHPASPHHTPRPRLHGLTRHARRHACGFHGDRKGERARSPRPHRRIAGRPR